MRMRKLASAAVIVTVCVSAWLLYSKVAQHRREAAYLSTIKALQRALPNGMTMTEVSKYLDFNGMKYSALQEGENANWTYQVKIGEDPGNLVCDHWSVYAAMEFNSSERLTNIHLTKAGVCL